LFFFFSSRRRHTRCYRDWSSDVCSSDLERFEEMLGKPVIEGFMDRTREGDGLWVGTNSAGEAVRTAHARSGASGWVVYVSTTERSEERRVGKGWRRRCARGGGGEGER